MCLCAQESENAVTQHLKTVGYPIVVGTLTHIGVPRETIDVDQQLRFTVEVCEVRASDNSICIPDDVLLIRLWQRTIFPKCFEELKFLG